MCGGGSNGGLFNAAVVECASSAMEGDGVAIVSFTVGLEEVRCVYFAVDT